MTAVALHAASDSDAARVYEAWGRFPENFERLTARPFRDRSEAQRYLRAILAAAENQAFHIILNGVTVGFVKAVVSGHRAQVGYVVHSEHWGRGVATSAVRQLVARLETEARLQRVWATCALDNPASARVLEKCGFEREGILRRWVIYPALGSEAVDNYSYVRGAPPAQ